MKPWMQRSLAEFDTAREASRGMAKTRATVASGSRQPTEPQPIRIHTEFQLNDMQDYSKRCAPSAFTHSLIHVGLSIRLHV